ncbi:hypothetical protein BDV93DRAFT_503860 [Ceratobasidium sp. AG-I]|nr:hypothetical protein BDV93DRAFT_503860 [Ceratobasidium sp. AG-I]
MESCLQVSDYAVLPRANVVATRQLLEQYILHAAVILAQIESTRQRLSSLEIEHLAVQGIIADAQTHLDSHINRLPSELVSKIFEIASEDQDGAIIPLSHVCRNWRYIALSSPRAWSKVLVDLSPSSNGPRVSRALAYLARSGACPLDIRLIANTGYPSDVVPVLYKTFPRWRTFSFDCSNSEISSGVIKSLAGQAPVLEELRLVFEPTSRAHADSSPRIPSNFSVRAPSLRVLHLNGVGINLEWASTLSNLHTLELIQSSSHPLSYSALLRVLASCASSLRTLKIHGSVSIPNGFFGSSSQSPLVLPALETLDLSLLASPIASLLLDIEAPNLRSLSLQDVRVPSDRWCSVGLRSFLRQPSSRIRHLRLCSSGLDDDDLVWAMQRMSGLETLELMNSNNTDVVLRALARPVSSDTPAETETWIAPSLHTVTMEQCHQITGTALVDSIKARNTRSFDSNTHLPIRHLRVQNCYQFERRHQVKLNKLTPVLQLDVAVSSFTFGQGGMRARSPHQNNIGASHF